MSDPAEALADELLEGMLWLISCNKRPDGKIVHFRWWKRGGLLALIRKHYPKRKKTYCELACLPPKRKRGRRHV